MGALEQRLDELQQTAWAQSGQPFQLLEPLRDELRARMCTLENCALDRGLTGERGCSQDEFQALPARTSETVATVTLHFPAWTRVLVSAPVWVSRLRRGTTFAYAPGLGAARVDVRRNGAALGSNE